LAGNDATILLKEQTGKGIFFCGFEPVL